MWVYPQVPFIWMEYSLFWKPTTWKWRKCILNSNLPMTWCLELTKYSISCKGSSQCYEPHVNKMFSVSRKGFWDIKAALWFNTQSRAFMILNTAAATVSIWCSYTSVLLNTCSWFANKVPRVCSIFKYRKPLPLNISKSMHYNPTSVKYINPPDVPLTTQKI